MLMQYQHILAPERVRCHVKAENKKQILETISMVMTPAFEDVDTNTIFSQFIARERLGSTGLGHGIALPHARLEACHQAISALVTTREKIPFEALDDEPVDIFCALLVPLDATEEHLQILAHMAKTLSMTTLQNQIRAAQTEKELYDVMMLSDEK